MNSLPTRIVSAIVALCFLTLTNYVFGTIGVLLLGFLFCVLGAFEYQRLGFANLNLPRIVKYWFLTVCILLMSLTLFNSSSALSAWGVVVASYFVGTLWLLRGKIENDRLLNCIAISALGFIYCALLPMFALGILNLPNGNFWFLFLFGLVFTGDVFAYFGGILFGKNKLMPNLSPSKTIAGSISGTIGSLAAGLLVGYFGLKTVPYAYLMGLSLMGSVLAQNGDLFESLLKRVASVKDSGNFMPGHGGVLDRLDGVYFAAPLIYSAAFAFSS